MAEKLPFLNLFAAFRPDAALSAQLSEVLVLSANIDARARTLDAVLEGPQSVGALLPRLETDCMKPSSDRSSLNVVERYWEPWSLWM